MKRSPIDIGQKSRDRGSTFDQRRNALNRAATKQKPKQTPADQQLEDTWKQGGWSRHCVTCPHVGCDPHHIVTKQWLRNVRPGNDALLWDERNRLWLCRQCHANHHARSHPVPWSVLEMHAPKVFQFARELGLSWWLELTYPQDPTRGRAA